MKWWPNWDFRKSPSDEGQIFDPRTYRGTIRFVLVYSIILWGLWHIDDFFAWQGLKGYENGINPRVQQWHRLIVTGFAIFGYGGALFSTVVLFLHRRRKHRVLESAKGQWYDKPTLTKQDLEFDQPEGAANSEPASDPDVVRRQ